MSLLTRSMFICGLFLAPIAGAQITTPTFPHPIITEVLAAVPSGSRGDANADGNRDAIGDEFIEIANPHDRPIQLKGYTILDADAWAPGAPKKDPPAKPGAKPASPTDPAAPKPKDADSRGELRFTFPDLELKPGEVVVIFNGYKQTISGNVGDATKAAAKNDKFHDAYVFTMKNDSPYAALSNEGDFVVLMAPSEKPVQVVKWGSTTKNPPKDALLSEEAPKSMGSVQREGMHGKLVAHKDLKGDLAGTNFSPGVFSLKPGADAPKPAASTPDSSSRPKPKK